MHQNHAPQPCFQLWQPVKEVWTNEDGVTVVFHGIITGILYKPSQVPGSDWGYQVTWYDRPGETWLSMPYTEVMHPVPLSADLPLAACDPFRQVWEGLSRA
jgi:hypothetical protein